MKYSVVYEPGEDNWSAYVPDLPGCVSTGADRRETEANIREAVALHIEGLRAAGLSVPEPSVEVGQVAA